MISATLAQARRRCAQPTAARSCVQARLNPGRAITLCCMPNRAIKATSMMLLASRGDGRRRRVDRLGHGQITDKGDQVQEGREEYRIADDRKQQRDGA